MLKLRVFVAFLLKLISTTESCDTSNMTAVTALHCALTQANASTVRIFYKPTHRVEHLLLSPINQLLDNFPVTRIHRYASASDNEEFSSHIREVVLYPSLDQMRDHLNFLVIGNVPCIRRVLTIANKIDEAYGKGILLRHFSLWTILVTSGNITADLQALMFDNTVVISRLFTAPVLIRSMIITSGRRNLECLDGRLKVNLFPLKQHGMNGRQLIAVALEWPPFTIENVSDDGQLTFEGLSTNILNGLAHVYNFTVRFVKPEDGLWGSVDAGGYWSGVVGMIQRSEADICIAPYSSTAERRKVMSFGYFYDYEEVSVIYKKFQDTSTNRWTLLTSAFKTEVYVCGAVTLLVVIALSIFVHLVSQKSLVGQVKWDGHVVMDIVASVIGTPLVQMPSPHIPPLTSARLLFFWWWFFCIIMTSVYTGNLIASFTVSRETTPFNTLEELATNENYELDVIGGTQIENILKTSRIETLQKIWSRISKGRESLHFATSQEELDYQRRRVVGGGYALVSSENVAKDLMGKHCQVRQMKEKVLPVFTSFVFPLKSPLGNIFRSQMKQMVETGLTGKWKTVFSEKGKICYEAKEVYNTPIHIDAILSAVVAICGCVVLATVILIVEYVIVPQRRRNCSELSFLSY